MRRREFITGLTSSAAVWPSLARAQHSDRTRRIAAFVSGPAPLAQIFAGALSQGLEKLGWTDGQNLRIDYRWLRESAARRQSDVVEVVALAPEVIVSAGTQATTALKEKTSTVPIVFVHVADPLSGGLVQSLARPGGNVTGFAAYESSIGGKWLEVLKEAAPHLKHVSVLVDTDNPTWRMHVPTIEAAAPSFGIQVEATNVRDAQDIERTIGALVGKRNVGMVVLPSLMLDNEHRDLIIALTTKHGFPAISGARGWIAAGGLIYYSSRLG